MRENMLIVCAPLLVACTSSQPPIAPSVSIAPVTNEGASATAASVSAGSPRPPAAHRNLIAQCSQLTEVVNDAVTALGNGNGSATLGDLRRMADDLGRAGKKVADSDITDPDLAKLAARYRSMTDETSSALRRMADAIDAHDVTALGAAQAALEKAVKEESPLVDAINARCQTE